MKNSWKPQKCFFPVITCVSAAHDTYQWLPSGQNLADSMGNPQGLWLFGERIHAEIWIVSETRIHMEMQGKFLNRGWNKREVSQTCKPYNSPKHDIQSSLGYFHTTGMLPKSLNCILEFLRETRGKFLRWNIARDSTGKRGGNIHIENSPSFPLNFRREIMKKFPQGWSPGIPP